MNYENNFSWSHLLGEHALAHHDGAVSLMIAFDGIDSELMNEQELNAQWSVFYRLLDKLPSGCFMEAHHWRAPDCEIAKHYLRCGERAPRRTAFSDFMRRRQAEHLSAFARGNRTALCLTQPWRGARRPWRAGHMLRRQADEALALTRAARKLSSLLPGGQLLPALDYVRTINCSLHGADEPERRLQPQLLLNEQLVRAKPTLDGSHLISESRRSRVALVYLYPDAAPGWHRPLASLPVDSHACLIIAPADTRRMMRRAEREQDLSEGMGSRRDRDFASKGARELAAFRQMVAEENLNIYHNALLIALSSTDSAALDEAVSLLSDYVERGGGALKNAADMQLPFYRLMQPGQGYRCPFLRPDHTRQVANMLPVQVFQQGERARPESLRLGTGAQLIGFNFSQESIAHSFTIAMTGAGKGVDKGATILETFPFGIDWYITEIGQSYRWVVEALGGVYTSIDPDQNAINPLPPYLVANPEAELPLNVQMAGNTTQALCFLLTGNLALDAHQQAAAQLTLQNLYRGAQNTDKQEKTRAAPNLRDYCEELGEADDFGNAAQREAARRMATHLESFLDTTEGRLFQREENLTLSEGITGVDLKDVSNASGELLKFYLVFLSLRMAQLAFYRKNPARILLDEMHVFAGAFPEVIGKLVSSIARMGRKEGAFIDLVTQGLAEIDCLDPEALNSMPLRTLLYRPDGHAEIASRIAMREGALRAWQRFPYPEKFDWRPGLRSIGERWFNLHLSFPQEMLAMVDTSQLSLKQDIANQTQDPMERAKRFCTAMESRRSASA